MTSNRSVPYYSLSLPYPHHSSLIMRGQVSLHVATIISFQICGLCLTAAFDALHLPANHCGSVAFLFMRLAIWNLPRLELNLQLDLSDDGNADEGKNSMSRGMEGASSHLANLICAREMCL